MRCVFLVTLLFLLNVFPVKADHVNPIDHYVKGLQLLTKRTVEQDQDNVESNEEKAFKEFLIPAQEGHPDAQYRVAWMLEHGVGTVKDENAAIEWYEKAAVANYAARRMLDKDTDNFDVLGARSLLKTAYTRLYLQEHYYRELSKEEVFLKTKEKAQTGDDEAQYLVAASYERGTGVSKDENAAIEWYEKAAEQGHPKAQNNLARYYLYKKDGNNEDNEKKAFELLQMAAYKGLKTARLNLSTMYFYGIGTEISFKKSLIWLNTVEKPRHHPRAWQIEKIVMEVLNPKEINAVDLKVQEIKTADTRLKENHPNQWQKIDERLK